MNKRVKKELLKFLKIIFIIPIILAFVLSLLYELLYLISDKAIFLIKKQFVDEETKK